MHFFIFITNSQLFSLLIKAGPRISSKRNIIIQISDLPRPMSAASQVAVRHLPPPPNLPTCCPSHLPPPSNLSTCCPSQIFKSPNLPSSNPLNLGYFYQQFKSSTGSSTPRFNPKNSIFFAEKIQFSPTIHTCFGRFLVSLMLECKV